GDIWNVGTNADMAGRRPTPPQPFRNCLIDFVAWRMRCSFSISAKRTWPSPNGPKPTPGETATSAFSISSFENSSDLPCAYGSGTGAQTNIEPCGGSTGQPARL